MPRNSSGNPLAQALEARIRAVVDDSLEATVRDTIRNIVREELAAALGSGAARTPKPIGARRAGRPGRRATAPAARGPRAAAGGKGCDVAGCKRPHRSMGYCAAHYQSARKYGWPTPPPKDFQPPPTPARGRPPKEAPAG